MRARQQAPGPDVLIATVLRAARCLPAPARWLLRHDAGRTTMQPRTLARDGPAPAARAARLWRHCVLWAGVAWVSGAGCGARDPDVAPPPARLRLTGSMVVGHALSEATGVRRTALLDMDGVVTCQVWLEKGAVTRMCGQLAVVEARVTIAACDWRGVQGGGPDGQADAVQISRRDPVSDQTEPIGAVENGTDAARYPSRVKAGSWVIELAGRVYEGSQ